MATYHAIAAVSQAILRLLRDACPRDVFPAASFDFLPLEGKARPMSEGITIHLYRVAANTTRRNLAARPRTDRKKYRPALDLDLYYLVTPWAGNPDTEHRLMGWAMRTLEDSALLPPGFLNAYGPETETFHPEEGVELVLDTLSLADLGVIWDQIRPKVGLSVAYVARMVPIESTLATIEAADVQTRVFDMERVSQT